MTEQRLMQLIAAYGASWRRWPEGEREAARRLLDNRPDLAARLQAEAAGHRLAVFGTVALAAEDGLPQGDATFRSDDAQWPRIGKDLVVAELGISWPHDDED